MNLFTCAARTTAAVALLGTLATSGCQSKAPAKLPATVTTQATAEHRLIPGTHVLLAAPPEFKVVAEEHALRLDELQFVKVEELPGVKFADYQRQVQQHVATLPDLPAGALQTTTFNGHPALFLTQPHQQLPGMEASLLAFGDSNRVVLVLGVYPSVLPSARTMVQKTLLTASYNPRLRIAAEELATSFRLDLQGSGFQPLTRSGRWMVYAPSAGAAAAGDSAHATVFRVTVLPADTNKTHVQDIGLALIREYRKAGEVGNVQEANTLMNGHYAYENVLTYRYAGKEGQALILLLSTPQGLIVFDGRAYDQPLERMKQFVQLAKTIRVVPLTT